MRHHVPDVLCHPDGSKSCGACCGMYNRRDSASTNTLERLAERTRAFHREARIDSTDSLRAFRAKWETTTAAQKLLSDLPNCPFLGLLDLEDAPEDSTVGCLVHPLQNEGVDGRDCGVYDRETCDTYLCAAHNLLRQHEKWLVIAACRTSYIYGLVITDPKFVRELFERTADMNGAAVRPDQVERAVDEAAAYFRLKVDWPYRADDGIFGQLTAGEGLDTPRRISPADALGVDRGPWSTILTCLGTSVETTDDLAHARRLVAARIHDFARAVSPRAASR